MSNGASIWTIKQALPFGMLLLVVLGLEGCSNNNVLPDTGPHIQSVYVRHIGGMKGAPARPPTDEEKEAEAELKKSAPSGSAGSAEPAYRPVQDAKADLVDYTRTSGNEIEQLFPVLPNPQIVMYVYPHLTEKGRPVPGYSTAFKMYDKDEYALPGEWIPDHPDAIPAGGNGSDAPLTASHERGDL